MKTLALHWWRGRFRLRLSIFSQLLTVAARKEAGGRAELAARIMDSLKAVPQGRAKAHPWSFYIFQQKCFLS